MFFLLIFTCYVVNYYEKKEGKLILESLTILKLYTINQKKNGFDSKRDLIKNCIGFKIYPFYLKLRQSNFKTSL